MTRVETVGNLPKIMTSFLTAVLPGGQERNDVYECNYKELVGRCEKEALEPQVLIDKQDTGRAFLAAVGAENREDLENLGHSLPTPVFYFAELDESRKRQFIDELTTARAEVLRKAAIQKAYKESKNGRQES